MAAIDDDLLGQIDWDNVVLNFDDFELSNNSTPLSIGEIEQFLMDDDVVLNDTFDPNAFLSDILVDSPVQSSEGASVKDYSTSEEGDHKLATVSPQQDHKDNVVDNQDDHDPQTKKRKRQLRNRDAAVRSRERKKEYVRDLEMKSKYFEAECRRLGMVLQCCVAENHALRLSLQNAMAVDASMTKQESAVLVMESLLLGSLLWFLGIICLLILPSQFHTTPKENLLGNGESGSQGNMFPRKGSSEILRKRILGSFMMGKSCKASRSRMKLEVEAHGLSMHLMMCQHALQLSCLEEDESIHK